jgi:hypothetical protein
MKALPAVSLASSLIQVTDFSIKITRKDHKVFQPIGSDTSIVENHTLLQDVANHLNRLLLKLDINDLKKLSADPKRKGKLSEPAEQLLKISAEAKELGRTLVDSVLRAQAQGSYGDPKWGTVREALMTVLKKKEVTAIKKKFKTIRKEVEANLMINLRLVCFQCLHSNFRLGLVINWPNRQYLDQSAETGLPVFTEEGNHIHHVEKWQNDAMDAIHTKDWKPKSKKDMEEFSKQVDKLIQAENEAIFCGDVFEMLHFPVLDDRLQSITPAQQGTFEWIYENGPSADLWAANPQQSSLTDWLGSTNGHNLFWLTGKHPASPPRPPPLTSWQESPGPGRAH